jgi:hypothetical protein
MGNNTLRQLWKVNAILKLTFFPFRHGKITQE